MKLFTSLDRKDRRMLLITLVLIGALLVLLAFFSPRENPDENTVPDSYLVGQHGAKAAFTLLQQSGYAIERWHQPLSELAAHAGPATVLILAEPNGSDESDTAAILAILQKGGRVVATGFQGGLLLPGNDVTVSNEPTFAACEAQPDGLDTLAGSIGSSGPIWILPVATWKEGRPDVRTAYTCAGKPVVVSYPVGSGTAVWWASSTPLENSSIARGNDMELLLNSVGPAHAAAGQKVYWDESLHSPPHSQWDFVSGPVWPLLVFGSLGLMLLVILSFSRRSGPVRALPQPPRTTPIEFLDALGSLYRSTGAATTAMQIAWERFRSQAALLTGQRTAQLNAIQIAAAIERRFGAVGKEMQEDLVAAEEACWEETLKPRRALALIQSLRRHEETLRRVSAHGASTLIRQSQNSPEVLAG
jgi:hypothetical protein